MNLNYTMDTAQFRSQRMAQNVYEGRHSTTFLKHFCNMPKPSRVCMQTDDLAKLRAFSLVPAA